MTMTLTRPPVELLAGVRIVWNPITRHNEYWRVCDRCPIERQVNNPRAKKNLCKDCCSVLSAAEVERWAA